jgi:hypothetical protein
MINKNECLTPSQVIERFPELKDKFGWSAKEIGVFYRSRLLFGYFDSSRKKAMITVSSVKKLITYANELLDYQKIKEY